MYATCLFCQEKLGTNESIEHFPVGRRLAFDAAKGRLWVVCRKCEHIGLARLKEGIELVRIGEPQRPEMAAWRYGDQFGRRRRRQYMMIAGGVVAVGAVVVTGSMIGVIGAGAINPLVNVFNAGRGIYRHHTLVNVSAPGGITVPLRLTELTKTQLRCEDGEVVLSIPGFTARRGAWWR